MDHNTQEQKTNGDNLIRMYHAELHDESGKVTITGDSLLVVQEKIENVLNNRETPHFEQRTTHTQLVYDRKGGAVVGWITEIELPRGLSKKTAENQVPAQAAA